MPLLDGGRVGPLNEEVLVALPDQRSAVAAEEADQEGTLLSGHGGRPQQILAPAARREEDQGVLGGQERLAGTSDGLGVPEVVGNARQGGRIGDQAGGPERSSIGAVASDEFLGQVQGLGRRAAVAGRVQGATPPKEEGQAVGDPVDRLGLAGQALDCSEGEADTAGGDRGHGRVGRHRDGVYRCPGITPATALNPLPGRGRTASGVEGTAHRAAGTSMRSFAQSATFPVDVATLAAWHFRPGALERLVPPWSGVRIERSVGAMRDGATAVLRVPIGPLRLRWEAIHEEVRPGVGFVDRMVRGPFAAWRHEHRFEPDEAGSRLHDRISFRLPLGALGSLGAGRAEAMLHRTFDWRHRRTRQDLARHAEWSGPPSTIAISGASGLVGSALAAFLTTGGHTVRRLVRGAVDRERGDIAWDPVRRTIDREGLASCDAVVHLAGQSIATRWSAERKEAIRASRIDGTRFLAETLASLPRRPGALLSASAIGYYGDLGEGRIDERGLRGSGFLADVSAAWEGATRPAAEAGIRVVTLRIGMVLSGAGGALATLRTPFSLGLGGPVGSGRQGISWIALDDLLGAIHFALRSSDLAGPVNAVAPGAISNREFGRTLGRVLRRPAILPLPGVAVRALMGDMGRELLLGGAKVEPRVLLERRFRFAFPELEPALRFELGA